MSEVNMDHVFEQMKLNKEAFDLVALKEEIEALKANIASTYSNHSYDGIEPVFSHVQRRGLVENKIK
jgi:hypothetical protein